VNGGDTSMLAILLFSFNLYHFLSNLLDFCV
jgi:hypothetical protein